MTTTQTTTEYAALIEPDQSSARNPFVGLRPFNSDESILFFGRRRQTIELMEDLHETHFIAVVGSSGCGKSSLVHAGLIPKLRAGFLTEERDQWLVVAMKPGDAPLRNLAAALTKMISPGDDAEACAEAIRTKGTTAVIQKLAPTLADFNTNLLLLVDQFEEIFRFGVESGRPEQRAEAADFVSIMLALAEQRSLPIYVVMTMRSDFLGDCDNFHGLPEAMNSGQYLVPRLTRQQRQQAIEGPIRLFGGSVSQRLLDRALNDVGDKSDQLPVMQHALMRTWERASATGALEVDLAHYEDIGGIEDALSKDAEAALDGMDEDELKIAGRMFQALTDTDTRGRRIRRPAHLSEIEAVTGAGREAILKIIERFRERGRSFLIVTDGDDQLIDISHESLIRQWGTMGKWVKDEARSREIYQRLANSARRLRAAGRDELYRGTDLQEALEWWAQREPNQEWARRYDYAPGDFGLARSFLEDSRRAEELGVIAKEEQRKHELQQAHELASEQRRRVKQLRWGLLVLLLFLAVSVGLATHAYRKSKEAEQRKIEAEEQRAEAANNAKEAERLREKAERSQEEALKARDEATTDKIRADEARDRARRATLIAQNLKRRADNENFQLRNIPDEINIRLPRPVDPLYQVDLAKPEQFDAALQEIMPQMPQAKRELYAPFLRKAMVTYKIDTPVRQAAFLAQIAYESAELRYVQEIWGPTSQQKSYDPPGDLAARLGNTQLGDGRRFRGRGPLQITGRDDYKKFGALLGLDLINNPDLAATLEVMFNVAALRWKELGLNELADRQDFVTITRRINGGLSGLAERRKYYEIAIQVLGAGQK
jgi:predicted chitinase